MQYKYKQGDNVTFTDNGGDRYTGTITSKGEEQGFAVYDLDIGHWCYEHQIKEVQEFMKVDHIVCKQLTRGSEDDCKESAYNICLNQKVDVKLFLLNGKTMIFDYEILSDRNTKNQTTRR